MNHEIAEYSRCGSGFSLDAQNETCPQGPVALDGPYSTLVTVNQRFIGEAISKKEGDDYPFYSASRLFSPNSIKQLNRDVDELYQSFQKQASLDQMFYPADELVPYKMVATLKRFDVVRYFKVPGFGGGV